MTTGEAEGETMAGNDGWMRRLPSARVLSLWFAIGVLVVAAVLGSVFILLGDQAGIAGRAWLTFFLAAAFAGAVTLDASLGDGPNRWYLPASISLNGFLLLIGLLKVWGGPFQPEDSADPLVWSEQLFRFVAIVLLVRIALLVTQYFGPRFTGPAKKRATRVFAALAVTFVWVTAILLSLPAALPGLDWGDMWWRYVTASALFMAVLLLIPIVLLAFEPRGPKGEWSVPGVHERRQYDARASVENFPFADGMAHTENETVRQESDAMAATWTIPGGDPVQPEPEG
jgi:hypothetical protein